jgi:hypothetical protein
MSLPEDQQPEYEDETTQADEIAPEEIEEDDLPDFGQSTLAYRSANSDPTFGYLVALALAVGLTALQADQFELRYTLIWGVMAGFGVLSWLLGNSARISQETPENLAWGVVFGLIIATPLLTVGGSLLNTTVTLLFGGMSAGTLLTYLVFVMPLAETLFFRGLMQQTRAFWLVGILSSIWGAVVFFPRLDISTYPAIVGLIALALVMMNLTYGYVKQRNGLAAAWVCQIVVNLVLLFFPFVSR